MKRREVLFIGAVAPFAPLFRAVRALAAEPVVAADSLFAVPLPTNQIGLDLLALADNAGEPMENRLGRVRLDAKNATDEITTTITGDHGGAIHLFVKRSEGWQRIAPVADGQWMFPAGSKGAVDVGFGVALPSASVTTPEPEWPRAFTVDIGVAKGKRTRTDARVAPFIIPSSLERVHEVWIVSRPNTVDAVAGLTAIAQASGLSLQVLAGQDPCDQWMQDTTEPGVFVYPTSKGPRFARAALTGQRAAFGRGAAGLDEQIAKTWRDRGDVAIAAAVPRSSRWIDWFGNIEVTPAHTSRDGKRFPYGRIITGKQRELSMHPSTMRFLETQGLQWPPIVVDTSWVSIGHIDEVVNFVPARTRTGYKVLLPSPNAARDALNAIAAQGMDDAVVFAESRDQTTVKALLAGAAVSEENTGIDATITAIRDQLQRELNLRDEDFAMVPALFARGRALIPNAVNCLVANGIAVASEPRGPKLDGKDLFEDAIRASFAGTTVAVRFIDAWRAYHMASGEVHCGTNTFRTLRDAEWWKHVK